MLAKHQKASEIVENALASLKNDMQVLQMTLESIGRDIAGYTPDKAKDLRTIREKLDRLSYKIIGMELNLKDVTATGLLNAYELQHPEVIDTEPLEIDSETLREITEIKGDAKTLCKIYTQRLSEFYSSRDPVQSLADYLVLMKELRCEIKGKRDKLIALAQRRKQADKGSQEQKNAATIIARIKDAIAPLERLFAFVLDSYFKRRKRIISEIWRTTVEVESLYDAKTREYLETIPAAASNASISSALKELSEISHRHIETHRANTLVKTGQMSVLERRKTLAALKKN